MARLLFLSGAAVVIVFLFPVLRYLVTPKPVRRAQETLAGVARSLARDEISAAFYDARSNLRLVAAEKAAKAAIDRHTALRG